MKIALTATALGLGLAACVLAPAANADEYLFSYSSQSGNFEAALGEIFTNASNQVTSISGVAAGPGFQSGSITGLSSYASADNLFGPSSPYVDFGGLSFSTTSGVTYNLYYNAGVYRVSDSITDPSGSGPITNDSPVTLAVEVVAVPEPSAWALMLAGLGVGGAILRYGRRRAGAIVGGAT